MEYRARAIVYGLDRALLQKKPMFLGSLEIETTSYKVALWIRHGAVLSCIGCVDRI